MKIKTIFVALNLTRNMEITFNSNRTNERIKIEWNICGNNGKWKEKKFIDAYILCLHIFIY